MSTWHDKNMQSNSSHIWFQQVFCHKILIVFCLVPYSQIFPLFLIFSYYFTHLKTRKISCALEKLGKCFPYYAWHRVSHTVYRVTTYGKVKKHLFFLFFKCEINIDNVKNVEKLLLISILGSVLFLISMAKLSLIYSDYFATLC